MEDNKAYKPDYIENQVNNNCQQFFGEIKECVFAMPGSTVNTAAERVGNAEEKTVEAELPQEQEELFHFIHPNVTDKNERRKVHLEIKNLVTNFPLPEIFNYLNEMAESKRIYYKTLNHANFRKELERLGLPNENQPNYSAKTFDKYFR